MSKDSNSFGRLLKFWRQLHGFSQEALALELDSSTRHISCLENAKAHPSLPMVEHLARTLSLTERDRCYLMMSAGYTPEVASVDFNDPNYKWLRNAMHRSVMALDPHPAALINRYGELLMVNRAWVGLYRQLFNEEDLNKQVNHYDLLFAGQAKAGKSTLGDNAMALVIMALQQEALISDDPRYQPVLKRLYENENTPANWADVAAGLEPMASYRIQLPVGTELATFFAVNQTVGATGPASYVSEPRLTIVTLYPENIEVDLSSFVQHQYQHPLLT
ncbi:helix-turn-helix transcriptional regulator [uncultured Umboniibacter sp.]|uniref:helix-turn-helix domain-containing protein n=1 Tax=uncultured Umboniibacter sp. TaxID=1798917 RepID=UPI00263206F8|nr:helix-turn-helix transcriptional regulator [uncultured Umboniibacter sp.]